VKDVYEIEQKISSRGNTKRGVAYVFCAILALVGVAGFFEGYKILTGGTSGFIVGADTEDAPVPPTPPDPLPSQTPIKPLDPPAQENGSWTLEIGKEKWTLAAGEELAGYDLANVFAKKITLFSFNGPLYPIRKWVTYPYSGDTVYEQIKPISPLGYYFYNPTGEDLKINISVKELDQSYEKIYARGWHFLYWSSQEATRQQILSRITLVYSDGTKLTLAQAVSDEVHSASAKIYVLPFDSNKSEYTEQKELTESDSDTTVSKVSKNSYFWIYLRRTNKRVTDIIVQ